MENKKEKRHQPPTVKDIAREAKVSTTTVSLALSNLKTSRVGDPTRKKIVKIAERLNYKPNYIARSLVSKKTHSIGLVVTTLLNPFYAEIAQDIIDRAMALGYNVSTCSARAGLHEERVCVEEFLNRGMDGLIICSALRNDPLIYELADQGVPFVLAMRNVKQHPGNPPVDHVGVDNKRGAFMAVEHLIKMGHKRIALISGPNETSTGYDRQKGALAAFEMHGIVMDPHLVLIGDFFRISGYRITRDLLQRRERPTAIFAANDHMAIGAIDALHEEGLNVPEDMALIGFDDIEMAGIPGIDLTTVSQKKATMGRLAVDHLISNIKGESDYIVQKTILNPILVVRNSCGFRARGSVYELSENKVAALPMG